MALVNLQVRGCGRQPVSEPAVDDAFGRAQDRDGLAELGGIDELCAHHPRERPAAGVRRQHADRGHRGDADAGASRHRHVERPRTGGPDDLAALVGAERAHRQISREALLEKGS